MDHIHNDHKRTQKPSTSELISSAKVVAGAVRSHDKSKLDKGQVAAAASNLLGAASHYGKLDEKSYGKYVGKAEDYLHKYQSTATTAPAHGGSSGTGNAHGGGHGDYLKIAEGMLKKDKKDKEEKKDKKEKKEKKDKKDKKDKH